MKNIRHAAAVFSLVLLTACSSTTDTTETPAALNTQKVDLAKLVEVGRVEPVNGFTSAGQPGPEALRVFSEAGYVAVIDLRTAAENRGFEEPAVVSELGMDYVALPVGGNDINYGKAAELQALIDSYDAPVLVHCGSANRVGALVALSKSASGADDESALAAGREAGMTRLEGKVQSVLDSRQP